MSVLEIIKAALSGLPAGAAAAAVVLSLIQVSKIPINPWDPLKRLFRRLLRSAGRAMCEDVRKGVAGVERGQEELRGSVLEVKKRLEELEDRTEVESIKNKRWMILSFYSECYRGIRHNREEYANIQRLHEDYEELIGKHGFTNHEIDESYAFIMKCYREAEERHEL